MSNYADFDRLTGPAVLTAVRETVNDGMKQGYPTLGQLWRGQPMSRLMMGGSEIRDDIFLQAVRVATTYTPGAGSNTYSKPQTGIKHSIPYRWFYTYYVMDEEEIALQGGDNPNMTADGRFQVYKDVQFRALQNMKTDNANFWEELCWAVPNKATMEAAGGQEPYSIPCFVNEYTNGLPASSDQPGGTWTQVMGIAPATDVGGANWVPQQYTYNSADPTDATKHSVVNAFDEAFLKLNFTPPPLDKEYFTSSSAQPQGAIFCSSKGIACVKFAYRKANQVWENKTDAFMRPLFGERPFQYVPQLDGALLYPTGTGSSANTSALSTETDTTNTVSGGNAGPRYFVVLPEFLTMIYLRDRFMKALGSNGGGFNESPNPTRHTKVFNTAGNMFCRSRRRHASIRPSADVIEGTNY